MQPRQTITQVLRQAAIEAGGIRPLAKQAGIDPASLARFVHGQQSLRLDIADRLAEALNIEVRRRDTERDGEGG